MPYDICPSTAELRFFLHTDPYLQYVNFALGVFIGIAFAVTGRLLVNRRGAEPLGH